jgi:archaellum component FlaF (FlaF/FlaG flagellin family)
MSGTGTAAATAIILMGLVIGLVVSQPSLDKAVDDLKGAREDSKEVSLEMANSQFTITSASVNNTTSTAVIFIRNIGTSVMDIEELDIIFNGTWSEWDFGDARYIYPGEEVEATLINVGYPISVKVIGRYGISEQTTDFEIVT